MEGFNIMAVLISHRSKKAPEVQEVFTKYGCIIKMRLGMHETGDFCAEDGLVILQLGGKSDEIKALENDLNALEGITAKTMNISSK